MEEVWLGEPQHPPVDSVLDIQTSRIGGKILLFRECENPTKYFCCPKCNSFDYVSLLGHFFAPNGCNDRVIYVLTCSKCSSPSGKDLSKPHTGSKANAQLAQSKTSFCFAIRSQNFNTEYYREQKEQFDSMEKEKMKKEEAMFAEDAEWGDDECEEELGKEEKSVSDPLPQKFAVNLEEEFPLQTEENILKSKSGQEYTDGIPLDLFKEKLRDVKSVEEEVRKKYGDVSLLIEQSEGEVDDASKTDKWVENYMDRIGNNPSQCVRWNPGGQPLRVSAEEIVPPVCKHCGKKRQFELQLTAPIVYYLTQKIGESNNTFLHFSNVLVFTCSGNCNGKDAPYLLEFVYTEDEL